MEAVDELSPVVGTALACRALAVPRATVYRHRRPAPPIRPVPSRRASPRALSEAERQEVRDLLHASRFIDAAPAQIYATLLDEGTYLCSERTMYRILAAAGGMWQNSGRRGPTLRMTRLARSWGWPALT